MQREGHALPHQRSQPCRRLGTIWPERLLVVNLAAEMHEVAVDARQPAQRLEPPRLVGRTDAVVLDGQAMVETRMNRLQLRERIEHRVDRFIAIRMRMNLHSR